MAVEACQLRFGLLLTCTVTTRTGHPLWWADLDPFTRLSSAEQREDGENASLVVLAVGSPSFWKMACTCRSTARELRKSCLAIARLERAVGRTFPARCQHLHVGTSQPPVPHPDSLKPLALAVATSAAVLPPSRQVVRPADPRRRLGRTVDERGHRASWSGHPGAHAGQVAADVVEVVSDERSAFSRWNVITEIERLHVHPFATPADRESATRAVVEGPSRRNVRCS